MVAIPASCSGGPEVDICLEDQVFWPMFFMVFFSRFVQVWDITLQSTTTTSQNILYGSSFANPATI